MLFEEVHSIWTEGRLTQAEAAQLLEVCKRTFRRYLARLREEEGDGIEALKDRRLSRASHRAAPMDEVIRCYRSATLPLDATTQQTLAACGVAR